MNYERRKTKDERRLVVYVDGAARGNPGPAGIGGIIYLSSGEKITEISEYIGEATNNVAEYSALILTLEKVIKIGQGSRVPPPPRLRRTSKGQGSKKIMLEICSDSELLTSQLKGEYKVKNASLKALFERVKFLLKNPAFATVKISNILREENLEADRLANQAIDEHLRGKKEVKKLEGIPTQEKFFKD